MSFERGYEGSEYRMISERWVPSYVINDDELIIHDPVWGEESIGKEPYDKVFLELVHNPLVRRSMSIEQLSLDADVTTIPDTAEFSRWEHIWGSVVFVRKQQATDNRTSPRDKMVQQLRTFVSDLGHTAYSHLGDWMFQGSGGPENQHDIELNHIMEVTGVNDILRRHEFDPVEVIFPQTEDWIECAAPELCVDRVDYGTREIKRWLDLTMETWDMVHPESFTVVEGRLVMTSEASARVFGRAFLLLATEHWSEPVHRLQLKLQEELVKRAIAGGDNHTLAINPLDYRDHHPRDVMYTVDNDITREMYRVGTFTNVVRPLMREIGSAKRRLFFLERRDQLRTFMNARPAPPESRSSVLHQDVFEYPNPLKHYAFYAKRNGVLPLLPSNIDILPVTSVKDVDDFGSHPNAVDFFLSPLKPRSIDPPFITENGTIKTLSEVDEAFTVLQVQQAELLKQAYVARLYVNDVTKRIIEEGITENAVMWKAALQRPRMSPKEFGSMIQNSATVSAVSRMIRIAFDIETGDDYLEMQLP